MKSTFVQPSTSNLQPPTSHGPRPTSHESRMTPFERVMAGFALLAPLLGLLAVGILVGGCMSENTGSSTVVGEQMILPEITDSSDNIAVRVFEDIKGARVWTAKDSRVTINYCNAYTNSYFGIVTTRDSMSLAVEIEPLAVDGGGCETNAVEAAQ